jgi:hypothetical protein
VQQMGPLTEKVNSQISHWIVFWLTC